MKYEGTKDHLLAWTEKLSQGFSYVVLISLPAILVKPFQEYLEEVAEPEYKHLTIRQASPVKYWRSFLASDDFGDLISDCEFSEVPATKPLMTGRFGDDLSERLPDAFTNAIGVLEHLGREGVAEHLQAVAKKWFTELKDFRAATPATLPSFYKEGDAAAGLNANKVADWLLDHGRSLFDDVQDGEDAKKVAAFAFAESLIESCGGPACSVWQDSPSDEPYCITCLKSAPAPVLSLVEEAGPQGWIQIKDRQPEFPENSNHVECNVLCSDNSVNTAAYCRQPYAMTAKGRAPRWEKNHRIWYGRQIIAWQPLPAAPTASSQLVNND